MRVQAKKMGLKILNLESLLDIEGGGGIAIPYIGYVEVNLQIPEIRNYNKDALMMVMNDSRYGKKVPFSIGTIHMHAALKEMTKEERKNMSQTWQSVALPAYVPNLWEWRILALTMWEGILKFTKQQYCHPLAPLL